MSDLISSSSDDLLIGLNPEQREAVQTTEGYVRVIAGAGSGKTKTLVHRYAYLVKELGIPPAYILCLTFTNKAAKEMRDRVNSFVNMKGQRDWIMTFHSFCVRILRENIKLLGYPASFTIIDDDDQKKLIKSIFEQLNISDREISVADMLSYISYKKRETDYIADIIFNEGESDIDKQDKKEVVFEQFVKQEYAWRVLDFDDLLHFVVYIFSHYPDILSIWQSMFGYIMVDETQDNDETQWTLIQMLQEKCRNLFVVGDPDQCIYEWRNANPDLLVNLENRFPGCKTIILNQNYRSIPNILHSANSVISFNKNRVAKDLITNRTETDKIVWYHGTEEKLESRYIVNEIKTHIKSRGHYSDIAILIRATYVSRSIEQEFIKAHIPYIIYGGVRFFERMEIKDIIAYLRLIDSGDDLAFLRVINKPKRKLGKSYVDNLKNISCFEGGTLYEVMCRHFDDKKVWRPEAAEFLNIIKQGRVYIDNLKFSEAVVKIIEETKLINYYAHNREDDRVENIKEFMNYVKQYEQEKNGEPISLSDFLQDISLFTNMDTTADDGDEVKIMTIHQAKGLEFPVVFVMGVSEGILPNFKAMEQKDIRGLEEERRLMYVAMTRAENKLYLTESEGFSFYTKNKMPSRFLLELKPDLVIKEGYLSKDLERDMLKYIKNSQRELEEDTDYFEKIRFEDESPEIDEDDVEISVGDIIEHKAFGRGEIVNIDFDLAYVKFDKFPEVKKIYVDFIIRNGLKMSL